MVLEFAGCERSLVAEGGQPLLDTVHGESFECQEDVRGVLGRGRGDVGGVLCAPVLARLLACPTCDNSSFGTLRAVPSACVRGPGSGRRAG